MIKILIFLLTLCISVFSYAKNGSNIINYALPAFVVGMAAGSKTNITLSNSPIHHPLPKGWHYGLARCKDIVEGLYCCVKREKIKGLKDALNGTKCLKSITFDELVELRAKKKKFEYQIIGVSYIPYYDYVLIYYIWHKPKEGNHK